MWKAGGNDGHAAQPVGIAIERCQRDAIIGAVSAAMHDDRAIDAECRMKPFEILERAILGRVAALRAERKVCLRAEHMHVAVASPARRNKVRPLRMAVGARGGVERVGRCGPGSAFPDRTSGQPAI